MKSPDQYSAVEMAIRTALILLTFVIIFSGILATTYRLTRPAIEASQRGERMKYINAILPASLYNNDLINDTNSLAPNNELGQKKDSTLYYARQDGKVVAVVFEAIAPDGYAGAIRLIIAAAVPNPRIIGVRVIEHKETPGLGDYVDAKKTRKGEIPWIDQFKDWAVHSHTNSDWRVKKDGGQISYHAGATVSARVVSRAIHRAMLWLELAYPSLLTAADRMGKAQNVASPLPPAAAKP